MNNVRVVKAVKYLELLVDGTSVKNRISFDSKLDMSIIGIDLSLDANWFYGINNKDYKYEGVTTEQFDDYDVIVRLLNWSRGKDGKDEYHFRILKAGNEDKVDFEEEKEYLKSVAKIPSR